ncbi:unnamed protein product [Oikopleura dioica]|uniref:Uncharacterized protein n=1 Tax=Oikopleura dioica TaxID=34765 RepID=E4YZY0_OIKDI|nr:unnamed protein product [Oikopleura dioica]
MSERTPVCEKTNSVCIPIVANNNEEETDFLAVKHDFDEQKNGNQKEPFWRNEEYEEEYVAPYVGENETPANEPEEPFNSIPTTEIVKDLKWLEENALKEFQSRLIVQKSYKTRTSRSLQKSKSTRIKSSRPKRSKKSEHISSVNNNFHNERLQELDCSTDSSDSDESDESSSSEGEKKRTSGRGIRSILKLRNIGEDPFTTKRRIALINNDLPGKISDKTMKLFLEPKSSKWKFGRARITAVQTKNEIDFDKFFSDIGMANTLQEGQLKSLKKLILKVPENFRNSFVKKYREKMRAKDENKNAKKGSEKDKIDEEWNNFFEEDETDWCTLQKPKVDIVKNKIHEKLVDKLRKDGRLNIVKLKPIVDHLIQKENAKEKELKYLINQRDELKKKFAARKEAATRSSGSDSEEDESGALEAKLAGIIES